MNEFYIGQLYKLSGLASYYGVVTKINKKTVVIQHNIAGRFLLDKETLKGTKNYDFVRALPIPKDNKEWLRNALTYMTFNNMYSLTEIDYIHKLDKMGVFDNFK